MNGAIPPRRQYAFMVWCLVKHRDNFTFYLYIFTPRSEADSHSASQKFPVFYGTGKFVTVFIEARHWCSIPRPCVTFRNKPYFLFTVRRQTKKVDDHPLSDVRDYLLNIFTANFHTWKPSLPSATQGRTRCI
jgi:hypothetical protein